MDARRFLVAIVLCSALGVEYGIDGVPALGVHGRFRTSAGMAGSTERTFTVVDYLVGQVRKTL